MGKEHNDVKLQVSQAAKIAFTKHNACWFIRTPDYSPVNTEVLITNNLDHHNEEHYLTTQVKEMTSAAYCLETVEKAVYQFDKRITRSIRNNRSTKHSQSFTLRLYYIRIYHNYYH